MFIKKLLTIILVISICSIGIAQKDISIENIRKKEFRGVKAIINQETKKAEGYYTFYVNEKSTKGKLNFTIAIFDVDLNLIKQTPIEMDKKSVLQSSTFNGKDFLFVFNGVSLTGFGKKSISYVTIDKQGNIIKTRGVELKGVKGLTEKEAVVYSASNGNFYIVRPVKERRYGYKIECVDRELNTKWEQIVMPSKGIATIQAIQSTGNKLLVVEMLKPSLLSKKAELNLRSLAEKDGKELFFYPLYDGKSTLAPSSFMVSDKGEVVLSGMYFDGAKVKNLNSNGIFFLKLDKDGKELVKSLADWDNGLQKHLRTTKKNIAIGSKPKVLFHEIVVAEDGTYQVIGETFRTTYQLVAIPGAKRSIGAPTSNDNSSIGFRVEDFIIFNFNDKGEIVNLNKIEKDHTKYTVYSPYCHLGGLRLAGYMQASGYFDFAFTTKKENSDQEVIIASNMANKKPYIGIVSIDKGEASELKRIDVENKLTRKSNLREDSFVGVVKSKPGHICIYYYDPKAKTINIALEPIDFD